MLKALYIIITLADLIIPEPSQLPGKYTSGASYHITHTQTRALTHVHARTRIGEAAQHLDRQQYLSLSIARYPFYTWVG